VGTIDASAAVPAESSGDQRLAILLAMAMFVLVVDTSLMNVSISAVVRDPIALQIALLIPLLAGLLGFFNGVRMTRLPDLEPSAAAESLLAG